MTRILLVEDHAAFRKAMESVLEQEPDLEVAAQAASLAEARSIDHEAIDLALVDIFLPDGQGTRLVRELKESHPHVTVLVLSVSPDPTLQAEALEAGADEVLLKSARLDELLGVIRRLSGA
jgi:DNA-binding NarL/FixJ family response regulator